MRGGDSHGNLISNIMFCVRSGREEDEIQPRTTTVKTVTDNGKNRYSVTGYTTRTGKYATVATAFTVSYYYGGTAADKARVDGYTKNITAKAQIGLLGGGSNTLGGSTTRSGSSGSYSPGGNYLYTVLAVVGTHAFSCNGGSTNFPTSA